MNYISHVYQNNILRIDFKGEIDSSNVVKIKDKIWMIVIKKNNLI